MTFGCFMAAGLKTESNYSQLNFLPEKIREEKLTSALPQTNIIRLNGLHVRLKATVKGNLTCVQHIDSAGSRWSIVLLRPNSYYLRCACLAHLSSRISKCIITRALIAMWRIWQQSFGAKRAHEPATKTADFDS